MKLLTMPSGDHQCLIYATAMLLGMPVDAIVDELGHDGMDTWWPALHIPHCYRGAHMQEIMDVCESHGYWLVGYQVMPRSSPSIMPQAVKNIYEEDKALERIQSKLTGPGLLLSDVHAYAWDGEKAYDPNGRIITIDQVPLKEFWKAVRI